MHKVTEAYREGGVPRAVVQLLESTATLRASICTTLSNVLQVVAQEHHFSAVYPLSLKKRLDAWRHGFTSRDYVLLDLDANDPEDYLSYLTQATIASPAINPAYADVLQNKVAFYTATNPHLGCVPTVYGTVESGTFVPYDKTVAHRSIADVIAAEGDVILKPVTGTHGWGVYHLSNEEAGYRWNGEEIASRELERRLIDLGEYRYLVCDYVEQAPYAAAINPSSTNTIRVATIFDREETDTIVASAIHRFGGAETGPTDNWSGGGFAAPIDVTTGELGQLHTYSTDGGLERFDRHPETNAQVAGERVPQWERVLDSVQQAASLHRENPYVGWDVVVTEDGPMILEGNCTPHLALQQLGEGLLENDRVREFFAHS